jgi:hypothetical protein
MEARSKSWLSRFVTFDHFAFRSWRLMTMIEEKDDALGLCRGRVGDGGGGVEWKTMKGMKEREMREGGEMRERNTGTWNGATVLWQFRTRIFDWTPSMIPTDSFRNALHAFFPSCP